MASIIDQIITRFMGESSSIEAASKRAAASVRSFASDSSSSIDALNASFGKGSELGQFFTLLKGGGAIAGVTLASRMFADTAGAIRAASEAQGTFFEKIEAFALKLPIIGNFTRGINDLGEAITGATAAQDALNAAVKAGDEAIQKSESFRGTISGQTDKTPEQKIKDGAIEQRLALSRAAMNLAANESPSIALFTLSESAMRQSIDSINTYYEERLRIQKEIIANEKAEAEAIKRIRLEAVDGVVLANRGRVNTLRELEASMEQFARASSAYTEAVNKALSMGMDGVEAHSIGLQAQALADRNETLKQMADEEDARQKEAEARVRELDSIAKRANEKRAAAIEATSSRVKDSLKSDMDRARESLVEAAVAFGAGKLDSDELGGFARRIGRGLFGRSPSQFGAGFTNPAIVRGSQEDIASRASQDNLERQAREQNARLRNIAKLLESILRGQGAEVVVDLN